MALPSSLSVEYLERLLEDYLQDPDHVPPQWRDLFRAQLGEHGVSAPRRFQPTFAPRSIFDPPSAGTPVNGAPSGGVSAPGGAPAGAEVDSAEAARLRAVLGRLADAYRTRGHLAARFDPLDRPPPGHSELAPIFHGLAEVDLDRPVFSGGRNDGRAGTLRERLGRLQRTYCGPIGVEFMHLDDLRMRGWLLERMEATENRAQLDRATRIRILRRLAEAVSFEKFVLKKYLGAKTFSLEGAEVLIALLDLAIEKAARQGIVEIVMGMAHRGRLNVLANILGKSPAQVFTEFEDAFPTLPEGGDVKYHLGHDNYWYAANGRRLHVTLCFNPSHLEFVNTVAQGALRAKQERSGDVRHERGMLILVHGDAAFAGEGIVQETLNLSRLPGYTVGGTLHVVINNQIGFTTSPEDGRSTRYATDVAKMLQVPIFHVHGEDPEAVAQAIDLATDFRHAFARDVVIDLQCYRRRGHNESDEPEFTQPALYHQIKKRASVHKLYQDRLVEEKAINRDEAERTIQQRQAFLEEQYDKAQQGDVTGPTYEQGDVWRGYRAGRELDEHVSTGVDPRRLAHLLARLTDLPEGFEPHPRLKRWLQRRRAMAEGKEPLDWSAAEGLALATLATEGLRVRLSGQDCQRGTFSHRHAVLHDVKTGRTVTPLARLADDQAPVEIINSPLCEAGALGFEYGYSMDYPDCLVVWEAQFGDFCNAAQVIVDQFITSAEQKWKRLSGVVMLLPHGFEGQGPEHSSARLERFLRLATRDNIQVVVPTTPAQYFHVLRRQMLRRWLKPLIVIAPKSLLRHPRVVSSLEDLSAGHFRRVLPDTSVRAENTRRVVLSSGKVYYDLLDKREQQNREDVALVRIEQLYPLPEDRLRQVLQPYAEKTPVVWVQEEPENMGACSFMRTRFGAKLFGRHPLRTVSRRASASPATGSATMHRRQQEALMLQALGPA